MAGHCGQRLDSAAGGVKAGDRQADRDTHHVLDGRFWKAAKAELGCLNASCWVYPAGKG